MKTVRMFVMSMSAFYFCIALVCSCSGTKEPVVQPISNGVRWEVMYNTLTHHYFLLDNTRQDRGQEPSNYELEGLEQVDSVIDATLDQEKKLMELKEKEALERKSWIPFNYIPKE